ncbi:MAG TPA: TlpA disulfide reductase family protein [Bryobacteraceae bacterium]|nr:TlpA disulfide reductase family protein [Bryobacteraceae bacterium]
MATAPLTKPSTGAIAALIALAAFTIFITWRAKLLEAGIVRAGKTVELLNKPAPQVTLAGLDGRPVSIADFRGKKAVIVTFWASWCGPCRLEMPILRDFYKKKPQANTDFEILAISLDDDREAAAAGATELKMPFPVLLDSAHAAADAFQVQAIPTMVVIDKDGKVTFGKVGFDAALETQLNAHFGIANNFPVQGAPNAPGH